MVHYPEASLRCNDDIKLDIKILIFFLLLNFFEEDISSLDLWIISGGLPSMYSHSVWALIRFFWRIYCNGFSSRSSSHSPQDFTASFLVRIIKGLHRNYYTIFVLVFKNAPRCLLNRSPIIVKWCGSLQPGKNFRDQWRSSSKTNPVSVSSVPKHAINNASQSSKLLKINPGMTRNILHLIIALFTCTLHQCIAQNVLKLRLNLNDTLPYCAAENL